MVKLLKKKKVVFINKLFIAACLFLSILISVNSTKAAEYSASLETDRANGVCTYTVNGIDISVIKEMTLKVTYNDNPGAPSGTPAPGNTPGQDSTPAPSGIPGQDSTPAPSGTPGQDSTPVPSGTPGQDSTPAPSGTPGQDSTPVPDNTSVPEGSKINNGETVPAGSRGNSANEDSTGDVTVLLQKITLDEKNCTEGTYKGTFSLDSLEKYLFKEYKVSFIMGTGTEGAELQVIEAGICDFSIHSDAYKLEVTGNRYDINRSFVFRPQVPADVPVPGTGNKIRLVVWKNKISKGTACGVERELTNVSKTWETDLSTICNTYGKYNASIVLENRNIEKNSIILASSEFQVAIVYSNVGSKKSASLEKKKSFRVFVGSLNSGLGINKVKFSIYNKDNELVCSKAGTRKPETAYYYADITLKSLDYNLQVYTVKASVTDNAGNKRNLSKTGKVDLRIVKGTISVDKKANATCKFTLSGAYIPGNIKNVKFNVYSVNGNKKKFYKRYFGVNTSSKDIYIADMAYSEKGKYIVYAYATTQWGKSILLNKKPFNVKKSELGKNGWIYETYAGREYKFYYKDNKLVTDLTDILGLKKTGNNLYLEINRAAGCVTAYAYDSEKKAYIIPVKSFTVSVGRDVSSTGTSASLNTNSSFTPLGSYSVSSNGTSVKYTLKPMYEPDGSIVYARWATHIVGNVYFHAVAVGSQSHYALNPSTYNRLGYPASAGCVRMTVADAKWIYDYAPAGTKVNIVQGSSSKPGPLGKNPTITVDSTIHYDPTDPEVPTSRKKADYSAGHISGYMTSTGKKVGY
ncbi:MAG: L,D-transpeptidase family protein [Lachnospiraceae bacterium]